MSTANRIPSPPPAIDKIRSIISEYDPLYGLNLVGYYHNEPCFQCRQGHRFVGRKVGVDNRKCPMCAIDGDLKNFAEIIDPNFILWSSTDNIRCKCINPSCKYADGKDGCGEIVYVCPDNIKENKRHMIEHPHRWKTNHDCVQKSKRVFEAIFKQKFDDWSYIKYTCCNNDLKIAFKHDSHLGKYEDHTIGEMKSLSVDKSYRRVDGWCVIRSNKIDIKDLTEDILCELQKLDIRMPVYYNLEKEIRNVWWGKNKVSI